MEAIQKAKILFYQGQELVKNDKLQDALDVLDDSIKLYNKDDDVYRWKGYALNSLSRLQESIECHNQAISINPNNDRAWINKDNKLFYIIIQVLHQTVYVDTKRRQNVVIKLYQLILIVITHGIIRVQTVQYYHLGFALHSLCRYQDAIEFCDKAIQMNPNNESAWVNKGFALDNLRRYEEAIECYDKAISINPNSDYAWNNKGLVLQSLSRYQEAMECCDKAISINPKLDKAWNNKGLVLQSLSRYQEAMECYDIAISINLNNDSALYNKGYALHQQQKYKDAIVCYDQALSICTNPKRLQNKADSLFQLGNKSQAKLLYQAALQQGSTEKEYIKKQLSKT